MLKKGAPLAGWRAFAEACPTCKNQGSNLCEECKMEIESGYVPKPEFTQTNANRIRSMTDEELARVLYNGIDAEYCSNDPACGAMLDEPGGIPEERCIACALKWLQQPAEEGIK